MPEKGRGDSDEGPCGLFGFRAYHGLHPSQLLVTMHEGRGQLTYSESRFAHCDFVVSSLDEPTRKVLELFSGLHEQVSSCGDFNCDSASGVAGPDV